MSIEVILAIIIIFLIVFSFMIIRENLFQQSVEQDRKYEELSEQNKRLLKGIDELKQFIHTSSKE